ncbi:MAG: GerMN domain-containing protein [Christensenellaceae bacterium]|nr:GerMN domain-containing protein [Christensenellaceae bacterium]
MKKSSKVLCAIAAIIILLTGCTTIKENNTISDLSLPSPPHKTEDSVKRSIMPSLYFFDSSYTKLLVETRELTVDENEHEADLIIEALLSGPAGDSAKALGSGLSLDYIEISGEIANAYLLADRTYDEQRKFIISVAITNTICDYFGVSYVSVFINGEALRINGYPCTVMQKSDTLNVVDLYNEYVARYSSQFYIGNEEHDMTVILYFPDETGTYILPEVRTIPVVFLEDIEECRKALCLKLIEELYKGPQNKDNLKSCITNYAVATRFLNTEYDEDTDKLSIVFSRSPFIPSENYAPNGFDPVMTASVYYTIAGALGGIKRMDLIYPGKTVSLSRALTKIYMGSVITLYFPDETGSYLFAVSRTVYFDSAHNPETYITELMHGPLETDIDELKPAFSNDMHDSMFNSVEVKNGIAYVDLTEDFAKAAKKMTDDNERIMFYSMINTLCSIPRINSVQFTIDGEFRGDIGGVMHIEYPLMPNHGLLR